MIASVAAILFHLAFRAYPAIGQPVVVDRAITPDRPGRVDRSFGHDQIASIHFQQLREPAS
jgi:hypothetical protein